MSLVLNVEILGEFKKLTQATTGAQNSLGKLEGTANKISKGMSTAFRAIGISLGAVALVNFAKNAVEAAEQVQVADQRLNQVTKSMGLFGDRSTDVTKRLAKLADQTELVTGVTAETTKQIQSTLMTFGGLAKSADEVGGSFDRATKAAIDLAAAGFGNATSNAIQLGKALNDPIKGLTSLTKSGVTFTEAERERIKTLVESNQLGEAQALILAAIETQVGGTAEATVTSSAKMKAAFGVVEDAVGLALLPVLEKFSNWVASPEGQQKIQDLITLLTGLAGKFEMVAGFVIDNAEAFINISGVLVGVGIAFKVFTGIMAVYNGIATIAAARNAALAASNVAVGATATAATPGLVGMNVAAGALLSTLGLLTAGAIGSAFGAYQNEAAKSATNKILFAGGTKQDPFAGLGKIGANGYVPPATKVPATSGSPRVAERGSVNITVNTPKITAAEITNLVNNAQKNGYTGQITFPRQ
jgi:hypothetical protein